MKKKDSYVKRLYYGVSIFLIALVVCIFIFYSGVQHSIAKKKFSGHEFLQMCHAR